MRFPGCHLPIKITLGASPSSMKRRPFLSSRVSIATAVAALSAALTANAGFSQTVWFKYQGNPVLDVGPTGSWDNAGVCIFRVVLEDTVYQAWYSGNDGTHRRMGYATSRDGIKWVKRTKPVLDLGPDGEWDWREATKGYVLRAGSNYHMWYHGYDGSVHRIGHAYSRDGIVWTKSRSVNPVVTVGPALWEGQSVGFPCVLREETGGYKMWYSGYDQAFRVQIGFAYAENPTSWTKHNTPVLSWGEPGSWDDGDLLFPNVLFKGDLYEMWYGGSRGSFSTSRTGHATSLDGIHWTKDPHNPVLTPGMPGSWDAQAAYVGDVHLDGDLYRMWYGGFDGATERTGFAVSPKGTQVRVSADRMYIRPGVDSVLFSIRVADPSGLSFSADIESPDGQTVETVPLFDDGSHGDSLAGDGLFANRWLPTEEKQYYADFTLHLHSKGSQSFKLDNAAEFTGVGPVKVDGIYLMNNKTPGPGDTVLMGLALRNYGSVASADSVSASVSTTDRWITGTAPDDEQYGTIAHGALAKTSGYYRFLVSPNCPPGREIRFLVTMESGGIALWHDTVTLTIATPWWRTTWAFALYGCSAVVLFFAVRRVETERIRRKHKYEMERFQAEQLQKLNELKSRFFANISHEFRTPLTLIRGPVEQMLSGEYKGDVESQYKMILRNSKRLERLVNQLLDLSKLESGRMKLRVRQLDIAELAREISAAFESLAKQKGVKFRIDSPPGPIIGWFDRDVVEKIAANLLSNALKFTPAGGTVEVQITHLNLPQGDPISSCAVISVCDTGIGIPPEEIDKVFDRFYQVDQSHTREYEGTGIGLALTKELVELHGGEITLKSQVCKGTTFTVRLPLGREYFRHDALVTGQEAEGPSTRSTLEIEDMPADESNEEDHQVEEALPLVLIIEDNVDMRKYIRTHLEEKYRLSEAVDGEEGVRAAIEAIPDLIISDVMMPKLDGIEVCRRLKTEEKTSHIPIILLTAKASADHKVEGLETGADDYITKPFDARELRARIKNLVEQRKKLREKFQKEHAVNFKDVAITSADERFLGRAMEIVEQHLSEQDFATDRLATDLFMSRMQLHRKMRGLTGFSPGEFVRRIRMEKACQLLRCRAGTIAEVAYQVGYEDPSRFSDAFRSQFGILPSEFVRQQAARS